MPSPELDKLEKIEEKTLEIHEYQNKLDQTTNSDRNDSNPKRMRRRSQKTSSKMKEDNNEERQQKEMLITQLEFIQSNNLCIYYCT